ncbi:MAG: alpha/beta hydrolase family protein [Arachidicoccus sp.]|nr:alpha/beta hydrolase family protein [Arachidicoccus sp.]
MITKATSLFIAILFFYVNSFAATTDTISIYSNAMHKSYKCSIFFPDDYSAQKSFPVVYLLNGYSGGYRDWINNKNLINCVDAYHIIVVCPDGGFSSWYFDSPKDSIWKFETYIAKEVPAYIDQHYHTIPDREHRGIVGLSMGGHGAMYLAIKHKDFFGTCASMSGGVDFTPFPDNWEIAKHLGKYEDNKELWEQNTVNYWSGFLKDKELAISFECGTDDFFINVNRALHQKLLSLKITHDYAERPGGHTWEYWTNAIQYEMLFFHNYFSRK